MNKVILCKPDVSALKFANESVDEFLFKKKVDIDRVLYQFNYLKSFFNKNKIEYIDIFDLIPSDILYIYCTNLIFVRDLFIKTNKGVIIGNMKHVVREVETEILSKILKKLNINPIYKCIDGEILEGGDYIQHYNITFIAVGTRTNKEAVYKLLDLDLFGTKKVVMVYSNKPDNNMHRIHLDCYFAPFGYKSCLLWEDLIQVNSENNRYVIEFEKYGDEENEEKTEYRENTINMSLFNYLIKNDYIVIPISTKSQERYGCNILELQNGKILVQDKESHRKIKGSYLIEFDEIHNMYGGIHCATNII